MRKPRPKPWTPFVRVEAVTKPQWAQVILVGGIDHA
jgi:hypothetical protein